MAIDNLLAGLSAIGFFISLYILYTQKAHKKLACIIGKNCEIVVGSAYAKTLGIDNSLLGVLYYSGLFAVAFIGLPLPAWLFLAGTCFVALFSAYLTYLQFFVIKGICDYCMAVNILNWVILAIVLSNPL